MHPRTPSHLPRHRVSPVAAAAALTLLGLVQPGWAQQAPAATGDSGKTQLEEVVVTANKRIEKLENVPMAISVVNEAELTRNNVREFNDVVNISPALSITYGTTPANNGINMRGIGTTSIGIGVEADVAVIVDDIPIGMQVKAFQDLTDVSRVEVLKGPQSTLFGKAAIAGAVNVTTKPITGAFGGTASVLYTSDKEQRLQASFGGEVSPSFGYRITLSDTDFAGNVNNLTTGQQVNGSSGKNFIGKFSWHVTDSVDVDFSPRVNHTKVSCCVLVLTSMTPATGGLLSNIAQLPASTLLAGITPGPDNRSIRNDAFTGQDSTDKGAGLRINYALPNGANLTSITSWDSYYANDNRDQDFVDAHTLLYYPLANGKPAGVDSGYIQYGTFEVSSKTEEIRLTSPDAGPVRYVAGYWYGKNDINRHFIRGYNGIALSTPAQYFTETYNINNALFGQLTWDFATDYSVLAGLRFNREVSGYTFTTGAPPPGNFVPTATYSSIDNAEDATTGKLSLQHQFSKNTMGYVMASTGYKGLAYDLTSSLNAATAAQQPVPSEHAKSLEMGFKGSFFDNRMTFNAAVFDTKFTNYQQNSGGYLPGTTTYVTRLNSVGGVQTRGFEFDIAALLTRNFVVNLGFAYTDATITSFPNAPCYNVTDTSNGGFNAACVLKSPQYGGTNVQDISGGRMPNAPKYKLNVGGQYDIPRDGTWYNNFITFNIRGQSDVLTNLNQDPTLAAPGYGITNVGFGFKDKAGRGTLSFFVNNLFDHHYANTGFTGAGSWSSKAPNPVLTVTNTTWTPARDAFRYSGVRLDLKF
jgi:iron complex outermembrane receptor protein